MAKVFRPLQSAQATGSVADLEFHQTSYGAAASESSKARQPRTQKQNASRALWAAANYHWTHNLDDIASIWTAVIPDPATARQRYLSCVMTRRMGTLAPGAIPDLANLSALTPAPDFVGEPNPRAWEMYLSLETGAPMLVWNQEVPSGAQTIALYRASSFGARRRPHPSEYKLVAYAGPEIGEILLDCEPLRKTENFLLRVWDDRYWLLIRTLYHTYSDGLLVAVSE